MSRALHDGRMFRAYREFSGTLTLKAVFDKPFLLTAQTLHLDKGEARLVVSIAATEVGTFGTPVSTVFGMNGLRSAPSRLTITTGGTVTGGMEREVLRANSGSGSDTNTRLEGTRQLPAGTYYMTLTVTGTTSGVYSFEYENLS